MKEGSGDAKIVLAPSETPGTTGQGVVLHVDEAGIILAEGNREAREATTHELRTGRNIRKQPQ